jgi:hypothetical protein
MSHIWGCTRSEAQFSSCGKYRFWLCREWGIKCPFGVFLLANPSEADALKLDFTITCCTNLALKWGWRGFGVINLNPGISSTPIGALSINIPPLISTENDNWIKKSRSLSDIFVLAAGEDNNAYASEIQRLGLPPPFHSIGQKNQGGGYPHPLAPIFKTQGYPDSPVLVVDPI